MWSEKRRPIPSDVEQRLQIGEWGTPYACLGPSHVSGTDLVHVCSGASGVSRRLHELARAPSDESGVVQRTGRAGAECVP